MKKINKIPAIIAAAMMLLYHIIDLAQSFLWFIPTMIEERDWTSLIVYSFLFVVSGIVFSAGLFMGRKGLPGALMVGGSGILYFLLCTILDLIDGNSPYFTTMLYLVTFAMLLFVALDAVKLPKPVGMLLTVIPAAFVLVLDLVQDVREFFLWGSDSFDAFLDWILMPLLDILYDGSLILAGIAVSIEPRGYAPLPTYGQPPYQPMPPYQQPMYTQPQYQAPQYQQPVYAQPQYQAPQYQQPMYAQPQYQAPQCQQPVYAQSQYQSVPQEQPAAPEEMQQ